MKMSQYFPKLYEPFGGDINVKVGLSNYATKAGIKNISYVDTSGFALKTNLANLKTEAAKLDIDKLVPAPLDLSKLNDVVKNGGVKKTAYDKLVAKVNNIDTSKFVLKTKYYTDKSELENRTPDSSGLVKKTDYNTNIAEKEVKIPDVSNLAIKTVLTTVENKTPNVGSLVKKIDYKTKVTKIENILNNHNHDNLVVKSNFDNTVSSLNSKIATNKTKNESIEIEFKKLKTLDLSYFIGKSHFKEDGTQNYLLFQPIKRYFKIIANTKFISSWKSKGFSDKTIKRYATSDNSLTPLFDYYRSKSKLNIYIVYELGASGSNDSQPTQLL